MLSLTISVIETFLSAGALNVLLRNLEEKEGISVAKKTVKKIGSIFTNFRADKD
jgi:hypothetical protein